MGLEAVRNRLVEMRINTQNATRSHTIPSTFLRVAQTNSTFFMTETFQNTSVSKCVFIHLPAVGMTPFDASTFSGTMTTKCVTRIHTVPLLKNWHNGTLL